MVASDMADPWKLASGHWISRPQGPYRLAATPNGEPIAESLVFPDAEALAGGLRPDGSVFPPEFKFSPESGVKLASNPPLSGWIPPFGARAASGAGMTVEGCRITPEALRVERAEERKEVADPDREMVQPPLRGVEFFSLPGAAGSAALVALSRDSGQLCLWAPHSRKWLALRALGDMHIAPSSVAQDHWRCEVVDNADGRGATIVVPTTEGLASVKIDALALRADISYRSEAPCLSAPLVWMGRLWVLSRGESGLLVEGISVDGSKSRTFTVDHPNPPGVTVGSPVSTPRQLVWPMNEGRITLEASARGDEPVLSYRPWPARFRPAFEFGSPFIDGTQIWQIGWSDPHESYISVRMDVSTPELRVLSGPPRLCTGRINYRLSQRMRQAPWVEPEEGSDGDAKSIFVPMIESVDGTIFGVRADWTGSLAELLQSDQKCSAVLELHIGSGAVVRLFRIKVTRPWEGRMFRYENTLWFFHPDLESLNGWEVGG